MAELRLAIPGEAIRPSASDWNEVIRAARELRDLRAKELNQDNGWKVPIRPYMSVYARNDNASAISIHRAVKPTGTIGTLSGNEPDWQTAPAFSVNVPGAETDLVFITLEPIEPNAIGRVAPIGCVVAEVNFSSTSHLFAKPSATGVGLVSGERGPIRVITAATGTGNRKVPVLLSSWWLIQATCDGGSLVVNY